MDLFCHLEPSGINDLTGFVPDLENVNSPVKIIKAYNSFGSKIGDVIYLFSQEVEDIFRSYVWYGNLRELKNVVKRATLLTDGDYIEDRSLPFEITNFSKLNFDTSGEPAATVVTQPSVTASAPGRTVLDETTLKAASIDAEYEMIIEALKQANFNKSKAAKLLNIDRKTLYNKMKQYQEFNNH